MKITQEVVTLIVFVPFMVLLFKQPFKLDYVWATNVKYQFAPEWTLGVGVYEVNLDNIKTESNSDGFQGRKD